MTQNGIGLHSLRVSAPAEREDERYGDAGHRQIDVLIIVPTRRSPGHDLVEPGDLQALHRQCFPFRVLI